MALMRFNEKLGTSFADIISATTGTVNFGLQGNDKFTVPNSAVPQDWIMFLGGKGDDTYIVSNNSAITIGENGNSSNDKIIAKGIGLNRKNSGVATIDGGRHLVFGDSDSGQQVVILDWQQQENRIETIQLSDGTYSYSYISNLILNSQLQDYSWESSGLLEGMYSNADVNEAIEYYTERGSDLEKTLTGGSKNDILTGDEQDNIISGGAGNDTLTGGAGDDTLTGGTGKDKYILKTGNGHDTITADASNKEDTLVLSDVKTLDEFKTLSSTQDGDNLTIALNGNDSVTIQGWYQEGALGSIQLGNGQIFGYRPGTAGDDILSGTTGSDIIMGGDGDDNIAGLKGKDAISAGAGNDTIVYDAADMMIDGGDGIDTLDASAFKSTVILDMTKTIKNFSNIENLIGGLGNDKLTGDDQDNVLIGGAGKDRLVGGQGNDTLLGGIDADTYIFAEGFGSDVIAKDQFNKLDLIDFSAFDEPDFEVLEEGQDLLLTFSSGDNLRLEGYFDDNDSKVSKIKANINGKVITVGFQVGSSTNNLLNGGSGIDYMDASDGNDTLYGLGGNDYLGGGLGNDTIYGGDGNDEIWDDEGINVMYGGKGNDIITADNGVIDSQLYGEEGNDTLEAWACGNTLLDGGAGNDTLFLSGNGTMKGGAGNDTYIIGGIWNQTGAGNIIIDNSVTQGDNGKDTLKIFDDRSDYSWFTPTKDDFTYAMNGTDLLMTYQGDQGTITIKDWEQNSIEKLMFADGTVITGFKF